MHENNSKDICTRDYKINYAFLSLISDKIHIGVIGSGRAGLIKVRHFLRENCRVSVITRDDYDNNDNIKSLMEYEKFSISREEYSEDFIKDKHLIIIAVDNEETKVRIRKDCDKCFKIYIDCMNFKEGMAVVPVQRKSKSLNFGVNTRGGNPKASVFIAEKVKNEMGRYDEFIAYTTDLRERFKEKPELKDDAMKFLFTEDFYFFFEKGKAERVIELFYNEV